ncbi:MAG: GIY-YIG nuclease family protein [Bacteroidia bacterium]
MKQYCVYILLCSDNTFYVGVTNNLDRRLSEHQEGLNYDSYTARRLPVELKLAIYFADVLCAIEFEKKIKKWSRRKKDVLINGCYGVLPELSKKSFGKQPVASRYTAASDRQRHSK